MPDSSHRSAPGAAARPVIPLDGEWRFVADPERRRAPEDLPPGDSIQVPGPWESQVGRPYRIVTAWYHRSLPIPEEWRDGRVVIRFGAVMYRCSVFLNGVLLGAHEGGYTAFSIDLTPAVRWGGDNALAVQVINPLNGLDEFPAFSVEQMTIAEEFEPEIPLSGAPHGKQTWYSSHSGLWQSVRVEHTPPVALGHLRIVPDLGRSSAHVAWTLETLPPGDGVERTVQVVVFDPDGAEVGRAAAPLGPPLGGEVEVAIPEPRLWSIGQGNLYRVEATLLQDGEPADRVADRFGMREISTRDGRILLNGEPIYLLGALDQDVWPDTIATPPSREALDEQFRRVRELGLNLLRCHIKVPDVRYLEAADEWGVLLWCELPNWTRFSSAAAARGMTTLTRMVETMGNHPSIVAWTIINEDWGTQLRWESRDRRWLAETASWLKQLDPTRLVVDNSACETPAAPNFHVRTDILDFHLYHLVPDNAARWRSAIEEFARRPAWLWSPHGDAHPKGDEPLVLSEFGSWGLPRVSPLLSGERREPWWFSTGLGYYRPTGIRRRFAALGLDRIWATVDDLAEATQWHQLEAFQFEVGTMRREPGIQGYVVTELTDAFWEANGLLDLERRPKAYHARISQINAPDVVVVDIERRDLVAGGTLSAELTLSSYGPDPPPSGTVEWELIVDGRTSDRSGRLEVPTWPRATAVPLGVLEVEVPAVDDTVDASLVVRALDDRGAVRATDQVRLSILPARLLTTERPLGLRIVDPGGIWGVEASASRLGHRIATRPEESDLIVTTELTDEIVRRVDEGDRCLVLVRTRDALRDAPDLARRVSVVLRKYPHAGSPGQRSPWEGDWVTSFSWILPGSFPGLPERAPLDFVYEEVLPDHVLVGYDPARHRDEVAAGMFVGWVHSPAALIWTFRQGRGSITLTTLHVAPESGPVATLLFERLIQAAATAERRAGPRHDGSDRAWREDAVLALRRAGT